VHVAPVTLARTLEEVDPGELAHLRRADLSVTEVCLEVGFTSLGSFTSTFTRLVGQPPGAYRAADHAQMAPIPPCVAKAWTRPSRNGEARGAGAA